MESSLSSMFQESKFRKTMYICWRQYRRNFSLNTFSISIQVAFEKSGMNQTVTEFKLAVKLKKIKLLSFRNCD